MADAVICGSATPRGLAQRILARRFGEAGIDSAALDARLLLCAALGIDHAALVRDPECPIGPAAAVLAAYADRRLDHEPVSRILGHKEFWGLSLTIGPDVLDPRPDTESLVQAILDRLGAARHHEPLMLLDLGTGSGAVLCALLHELPNARGLGVDRSLGACAIARQNLRDLGLAARGTVIQSSWCDALGGRFDAIVSNPPYIAHAELATLARNVRDYDPMTALDGGCDGLAPYDAIIPALPRLSRPNGVVGFEIGWTQGEAVSARLRAIGLRDVAIARDLAGRDRIVCGKTAQSARTDPHEAWPSRITSA